MSHTIGNALRRILRPAVRFINYLPLLLLLGCDGCPWFFPVPAHPYYDFYADPAFNRDGTLIVYSVDYSPPFMVDCSVSPGVEYLSLSRPDTCNGLWIMNTDGRERRCLYLGNGVQSPEFSPDGEWIVFTHWPAFSNYSEILKIHRTGDSLQTVIGEGKYHSPSWSIDGEMIVCLSTEPDNSSNRYPYRLWYCNADGSNLNRITRDDTDFFAVTPTWLDKTRIIFSDPGNGVSSIDTSGRSYQTIFPWYEEYDNILFFHLSPAKDCVLYSNRSGGQISLQLLAGGEPRHYRYGIDPNWSPDGNRIVFTYKAQEDEHYNAVWIMDSNGRNAHQVTVYEGLE